jgi:hypothetical protein
MPLQTKRLEGWSSAPVPHAKREYPQPNDPHAPRNYWCAAFVAPRGVGKTQCLARLIHTLEQRGMRNAAGPVAMRTILISPTAEANPVYHALKSLAPEDIHTEYSDDLLSDIIADIKAERMETEDYARKLKLYEKFRKMKRKDIERMPPEELHELEEWDFEPPPKPTYPNGVVTTLILDDLVGSVAFKQGKSALTHAVVNGRHLGLNIAVLVQSPKAVPKTIRANVQVWVLFKFGSKAVRQDLYEEVGTLSEEQFEELYDFATSQPHSALVIDFTQTEANRYKRNFDEQIQLGGGTPNTLVHASR